MVRQKITDEDLKKWERSVVLIHGVFAPDFFSLFKDRDKDRFFVMEGRPSLEAAQKNCAGLNKIEKTPVLISDNMAGFLFYKNMVKEVWLAYRESDSRGAFCFIGASILGILAKQHEVPVFCYPAPKKVKKRQAPKKKKTSEDDFLAPSKELISFQGVRIAPKGTAAYVPLMEWVPGSCFQSTYAQNQNQPEMAPDVKKTSIKKSRKKK